MSEKQIQFNFNVMLPPDFTDLDKLESQVNNKTEYLQEISKTKKELNQLGALLNSSIEDVVYNEDGTVEGISIDPNQYDINNSTISDVMDNDDYEGGVDSNYNKLLPPSNTAAFNQALEDLNNEADTLGILADLISNDKFIQDLLRNAEEFTENCEENIENLVNLWSKITSEGRGAVLQSTAFEGGKQVLKTVLKVALDKFDLDKITNQLVGDKINLVDQAINKYTAMDQTGLAGSLKSKYNVSFKSLTSSIFKKTYSNIRDVSNKGIADTLTLKSTREAAMEGVDKIWSMAFITNVGGTLADVAGNLFNKSIVGSTFTALKTGFTAWDLESFCYKMYLVTMLANYALKNNLMDAAAAQALLTKVGQDFVQGVLQNIGTGAGNVISSTTNNSKDLDKNQFSDLFGDTSEYNSDVYDFLNKISTGSTYSSLSKYVDLFQKYALNNHNTGLKTIGVEDDEGVLQMFEYLKGQVSSNNSNLDNKQNIIEYCDKITNEISGTQSEVVDKLTGEIIDVNNIIKQSIKQSSNKDVEDLKDYIDRYSYNPNFSQCPTNTNYWIKLSDQKNDNLEDWQSSKNYEIGDCVNYKNKSYKCKNVTNGQTISTVLHEMNTNISNKNKNILNSNTAQKSISYKTYNVDNNGQYTEENNTINYSVKNLTINQINKTHIANDINNVKNITDSVNKDINVYKDVVNDYNNTIKTNNIQAFNQQENIITYRVDNPQQFSECVRLHIKYRTQKLKKLSDMNKLYFSIKSE